MVALRRPAALLVSSLMATSTLFLAGVSPAAADPGFDALQAAVAGCPGDDIQVGVDINPGTAPAEVQDVLTVGCDTTIDIRGHEINVSRIVIEPGNKLTIKDSAYIAGSHVWATNTVDEGAAIRTTDAELVIESGSVAAYSSGDGAAIGGDGGQGGGTVTIGADADVTAATPDGNAVGLGLGGSSFGSLTVNGTLRMQQNSFAIPNSNADGPEITIGTTGRIVGVSAGAEEVGEPLTGSGQIDNHGAIALPVDGPTVLDHHYSVSFVVPEDVTTPNDVTVYAATFDSGSRDLPVPTRDGYTFTGWTYDPDGDGPEAATPFDGTTTLPGSSADGEPVLIELVASFVAPLQTFETPTITIDGAVQVGKTVTAVVSDTPAPEGTTITGQWMASFTIQGFTFDYAIGAPGPTYKVEPSVFGGEVFYRETRAKDGYTTLVTESPRQTVAKGQFDVDVALSDTEAAVGAKLSAAVDPNAPTGSLTYQWVIDDETVSTLRSYRPTLDDVGKTITVTVTGSSIGYETRTRTSTTDPVGLGQFTDAGTEGITISGTPKVGNILTASSDIEPSPAPSSTKGRWYRGSTPIPGATAPTYLLTAADVTSESVDAIRYEETRKLAGYTPLVSESESVTVLAADPVGPGAGAEMTLSLPAIDDVTPVVGGLLTVVPGTASQSDAVSTYVWKAGTRVVGSGETYTPKAADVASTITVTQTASKTGYESATQTSTATAMVANGVFTTGPTATISGIVKAGEELTASTGATSPLAGDFTYRWFAGDTAISGATGARFTPTSTQVGRRISVEITARRDGYTNAVDRSSATAAVASKDAPSLSFAASRSSVRLGEQADLTWSSTGATSVSAGGGWGSLKGLSGSESVKPGALGVTTYTLTATNENGTTTAQVAVVAGLPAERLGIDTSSSVKRGRSVKVRVKGLAPGEVYTIRISGAVRATGTASSAGTVSRSVRVPRSTKTGERTVSVTGSVDDRYGKTSVKVKKR